MSAPPPPALLQGARGPPPTVPGSRSRHRPRHAVPRQPLTAAALVLLPSHRHVALAPVFTALTQALAHNAA